MPVLDKCLCCCQLRTGTVVIGWMGSVLHLISLAAVSVLMAEYKGGFMDITVAVALTLIIISLITHVMLIWGAVSKSRLLLLPWLISTMVSVVICFLITTIDATNLAFDDVPPGYVAAFYIVGYLITGIKLYMWLCVLSLFQELHKGGGKVITYTPAAIRLPPYTALHESC